MRNICHSPCAMMKDVGICLAYWNVKLARFYFLAYRHHGDIDFNEEEDEESCNLNSTAGVHPGQEWLLMFRFKKFKVVGVNLYGNT